MSDEPRYTFADPDSYCYLPAQLMAEMAEMRRRVTVDWPTHNDQPAEVVHVAGYTGPPQ